MVEHYLNISRGIIIGVISSVLAYITPIYDLLICIGMSFAGNFLWGYVAGIVVQKESFNLKKAKVAIYEVLLYVSIVACIFIIGEKMKNQEFVLKCLSLITWVLIYFYIVNIFRNLKRLFPKSRGIFFIYFVISIEFIKHFPYMKEFLEDERKQAE
jgi:hypothetical protein